MKYQVMITLGNFDTWQEAHEAKLQVTGPITSGEILSINNIIESRVVDSNYQGMRQSIR